MSGTEKKRAYDELGDFTSDRKECKYYLAYEDRYRKVYEQGVGYWSAFPGEIEEDLEGLEELLRLLYQRPSAPIPLPELTTNGRLRVLEPGCGEAPLAVQLMSRGFDYVGVDLAASALSKARERIEAFLCDRSQTPTGSPVKSSVGDHPGLNEPEACPTANHLFTENPRIGKARLLHHDVTDLFFLEPQSFDLAIDSRMLHMLVVDWDRDRYLRGLYRALKPGALVLFRELVREDAYDGPVESFDEYMSIFAPDLTTVEERTAFNAGKELKVKLTRLPARPKSKAGYLRELGRCGFEVLTFAVLESGFECRMIAQRSI